MGTKDEDGDNEVRSTVMVVVMEVVIVVKEVTVTIEPASTGDEADAAAEE